MTRQTTGDGIWFWGTALTGPEALAWQIGVGLPPAPESEVLALPRLAAAYTLTGEKVATAAPEPPTWALFAGGFALAGLMSARWRRRPSAARLTA